MRGGLLLLFLLLLCVSIPMVPTGVCVSQIKDLTAAWEEVLIAVGRAGHSDLSQTYVFAVRR